jgi:hypothetical protein
VWAEIEVEETLLLVQSPLARPSSLPADRQLAGPTCDVKCCDLARHDVAELKATAHGFGGVGHDLADPAFRADDHRRVGKAEAYGRPRLGDSFVVGRKSDDMGPCAEGGLRSGVATTAAGLRLLDAMPQVEGSCLRHVRCSARSTAHGDLLNLGFW